MISYMLWPWASSSSSHFSLFPIHLYIAAPLPEMVQHHHGSLLIYLIQISAQKPPIRDTTMPDLHPNPPHCFPVPFLTLFSFMHLLTYYIFGRFFKINFLSLSMEYARTEVLLWSVYYQNLEQFLDQGSHSVDNCWINGWVRQANEQPSTSGDSWNQHLLYHNLDSLIIPFLFPFFVFFNFLKIFSLDIWI